jgi:hypothetical protein
VARVANGGVSGQSRLCEHVPFRVNLSGLFKGTMKQIKTLFTIATTALVLCSCASQLVPATVMPTQTAVPAPTVTASITPVPTSSQTPTATPIPAWVTDFAEPIQKAIENQPPKFQDDFSDPNSNWIIGKQTMNLPPEGEVTNPGMYQNGETGYLDGEYFTIASPKTCIGGTNSRIGSYQDFVAEFDVRFISGTDGDWEFHFHIQNSPNSELYALNLIINTDYLEFQKSVEGKSPETWGVGRSTGGEVKGGLESNHIVLMVRGTEMAVYANGIPALHILDTPYSQKSTTGEFSLVACHMGNDLAGEPVEVRWDNLKLWDISLLP